MKHLPWAAATLAAFLLGWWLGQRGPLDRPDDAARPSDPDASHVGLVPAPAAAVPEPVPEPAADRAGGPGAADMAAALERLDGLQRSGDRWAAEAERQVILGSILDRARAGRAAEASAALSDYRAAHPFDADALLLESDLHQMAGRASAAVDSLLALLQLSQDAEAVARARQRLGLLIGVQESQLANQGDVAGAIRLFEDLVARDPGHDGHRLSLARWLLRAGRAADAERLLRETGLAGVTAEAHADLLEEVRLARSGLPLEHGAGAVHVRASQHGQSLRLLVDTGATNTVIGRERARALAATPTGEQVRVRTAAGVIDAEIHLVRDLRIGELHLDALPVLVLDRPLPDGVDGLLGMDVISRFGGPARAGLLPGGER